MTVYTFPSVTARAERSGKCPECGKRVKRSHTVENTVSPFNKHPDGTPRTYGEVQEKVRAEGATWEPTRYDLLHQKCWEALTPEQHEVYAAEHRAVLTARREAQKAGASS